MQLISGSGKKYHSESHKKDHLQQLNETIQLSRSVLSFLSFAKGYIEITSYMIAKPVILLD